MPRWRTLMWLISLAVALPAAGLAQSGPAAAPPGWNTYGPGFARTGGAPAAMPTSGPVNTVYHELPDDTGWLFDEMPVERVLKETFRNAYFRVEYLLWDISEPGTVTLSAPTNYPQFTYPPDLVRNPLNPTQFIPVSIWSVGRDPTQTTSTTTIINNFNGGGQRSNLPPVYHITNPALLVDPTALPPMYIATMPTTEGLLVNENNGIRGTFGFEFPVGAIEASVFALASSVSNTAPRAAYFHDRADIDDDDGDGIIGDGITNEFLPTFDTIAQAVLIDGVAPSVPIAVIVNEQQTPANPQLPVPTNPGAPINEPLTRGDNLRIIYNPVMDPVTGELVANPVAGLYNPATGNRLVPVYQAALMTQVWGAEGNYIAPAWDGGADIQVQPLAGFRYLNFQEDLRQSGVYRYTFINPNTNLVDQQLVNRKIDSTTINNLFGPQIGLRGEFSHKWLTIGAQPKVMLGMNAYETKLQTENILRPDDNDQRLGNSEVRFGSVADLEVYSRVKLSHGLSIFVGYNFVWAGQITRPADNIVYNAHSLVATPTSEQDLVSDFKLKPQFSSAIIQGLSVGGELRF